MVANLPVDRPGTLDFLVQRTLDMQRQIDELGRQSKFPISAGSEFALYDPTTNIKLLGTDTDLGYGLSAPFAQTSFVPYDSPNLGSTLTTYSVLWVGDLRLFNPACQGVIAAKLVSTAGAARTATSRWHVTGPSGYSSYSTPSTLSLPGSGTAFGYSPTQSLLVPASLMNGTFQVFLEAKVDGTLCTSYAAPSFFAGAPGSVITGGGTW